MRTCPTFSLCSHLVYYGRRGAGHDLALLGASVHSRLYATATIAHKAPSTSPVLKSPFAPSATQPHDKLGHASTLTALHKARELVTRVLPPQSPELSFWNDILRDVSDQTSRSSLPFDKEKITIVGMSEVPVFRSELRAHTSSFVVYSVDEFSGGETLVSALLQDPFSPEADNARIAGRWEGREQDTRLDIE